MPVPKTFEYLKVHYPHGENYMKTMMVIFQPEEEVITKVMLPKKMLV